MERLKAGKGVGRETSIPPVETGCDAEAKFRDTVHDCFVEQRVGNPQEEKGLLTRSSYCTGLDSLAFNMILCRDSKITKSSAVVFDEKSC